MVSSDEVVYRLRDHVERHKTSNIHGKLALTREDLQVMSDPSQPSTAVLQQAILDLAAQVSALVAAQAGAPSGPAVGSAPSGHAQPNSSWTRDVEKFDGNGYEAAREFVRNANGVRVYVPPSVNSHTVAVMLSNKLTGSASVWYEQFQAADPHHSLDDFLNAFKKRFIGGRKAQTSLRDDFYDISKYTGTLEEAYTRMTELLSNLEDPPKEVDKIATLRKVIREPTIRLELDRSEPKTLEEAYAAAVNAATAVRSARASATNTNSKSNPPRSQSNQRPGRGSFRAQRTFAPRPHFNQMHVPPSGMHPAHAASQVHAATAMHPAPTIHPSQAYAPPFMSQHMMHTETREEFPRLARLDDDEYRRCREQGLCFRCRQPGHRSRTCPRLNMSQQSNTGRGNFRNSDASRR